VCASAVALSHRAVANAPDSVEYLKAVGGLQGTRYVPRASGDAIEYSEQVVLDFSMPLSDAALRAAANVTPSTPWKVAARGRRALFVIRKEPGVTYRVSISSARMRDAGIDLARDVDYRFTTASPVVIPAPIRGMPNEPYRYGALANGQVAERAAAYAAIGVRFVRLDYNSHQIEPQPGFFNWTGVDRDAAALAAKGVTELPIVSQYNAALWQTDDEPYPAIFTKAEDYASFAGAIAAHIVQRFPKITRIELLNEPNNKKWGNFWGPDGIDNSGVATARYLRLAYAAVKAAAPHLTVVGPGLADGGSDVDARTYFENLENAGCRTGTCWDVLSVHTYDWENPEFPCADATQSQWLLYRQLQRIDAHNSGVTPHVMITEWGYSDVPSVDGFAPAVVARYLALGFNLMLADPTIDGVAYTHIVGSGRESDFYGAMTLRADDGTERTGAHTFAAFADKR